MSCTSFYYDNLELNHLQLIGIIYPSCTFQISYFYNFVDKQGDGDGHDANEIKKKENVKR